MGLTNRKGSTVGFRSSALKGGISGPAIIPGKSAESRMIRLVAGLRKRFGHAKKGGPVVGRSRSDYCAVGSTRGPPGGCSGDRSRPQTNQIGEFQRQSATIAQVKNKAWARESDRSFHLAKLRRRKVDAFTGADRRTWMRRSKL